ncbi:hypothetical protein ABIB26_001282 [Arthrobacter sp. UYEF20]
MASKHPHLREPVPAAAGVDLEALPFTGSPLNQIVRELLHPRQELSG